MSLSRIARYHLFRVETLEGKETFIVAEDEPAALEIFSINLVLQEDGHVLYRVFEWDDELTSDQREKIAPYLLFGPIGVVKWCGTCGWSVEPPG